MKTTMKKTLTNRVVMALSLALAFVALMGLLQSAEAKVVVRVSVVTPTVAFQVGNGPVPHLPVHGRRVVSPAPRAILVDDRRPRPRTRTIRNHRGMARKLRTEDRRIARRLQRSTGVDKNLMLGYRRAGWTWPEIAFELRIRRADLAHAMNPQGNVHAHRGMEACTYQFNHR